MRIRIFTTRNLGLDKYINFLRLELGGTGIWTTEVCDPMKWSPTPGDIHIYIDVPVRLAVPWAAFNILCLESDDMWKVEASWKWASDEMDMITSAAALGDRKQAIPVIRSMIRKAVKSKQRPNLPSEPAAGAMPPKVGVITLTRNRKAWWPNMVQNVLKQKWPVSRLEWIIVDDGDDGQRLVAEIDEFTEAAPGMVVRYVEMQSTRTIGSKRNAAVEAAGSDVSVFVCMDDDDHYPANSVARRVAWLQGQRQIAYCSVLPMYDLTRYISAVNVPELDIGPAERVSEASLAFTRGAWTDRPFPDVNMAEGLGFIEGREKISVELPPNDIIVSFIHTSNSSSRRIPADQEPNGCHYGFSDDYFKYLHSVGGGKSE